MNSYLRTVCEANNVKVTTVRKSLYDLLIKTSPLSADDFFEVTKQKGFDTVSVYRTLDVFSKIGLLDEFGVGRRRIIQARTENDEHHHFIRCDTCGAVQEFEDNTIEYQLGAAAAENGFPKIKSHYLEIIGLCQNCADTTFLV
jgi:Fe2+ or Zn2+ uptake regulation protein